MSGKPKCKVIGTNGNVFAVMGKVVGVLKQVNLKEEAKELRDRIMAGEAHSYEEALAIMEEYVEFY
jgi:hypothetical protein